MFDATNHVTVQDSNNTDISSFTSFAVLKVPNKFHFH